VGGAAKLDEMTSELFAGIPALAKAAAEAAGCDPAQVVICIIWIIYIIYIIDPI
jgi:hypothetical protein